MRNVAHYAKYGKSGQNIIVNRSQFVVNFKGADYQLFNGTIVKGFSKGAHFLTIISCKRFFLMFG